MRRILITSLALCTAALSAACSDSACDSDLVAGGMAMVRAVPQSVTAEAAYANRVCLIRSYPQLFLSLSLNAPHS